MWAEVAVTLSMVGADRAIFRVTIHYFPIFEEHSNEHAPERMEETEADSVGVG
jgi:hypothetical protein